MKHKNKNIDKFFSAKLPDPEVPAGEAWGKMNDMFNPQVPTGNAGNVFNAISTSAVKLVSGLTLLGLTVSGVVLFLNNDNAKSDLAQNKNTINTPKATPEIENKRDTLAYNDLLTNRTESKEGNIGEEAASKEEFVNKEVFSDKQTFPNIEASDHEEALVIENASVNKEAAGRKRASANRKAFVQEEIARNSQGNASKTLDKRRGASESIANPENSGAVSNIGRVRSNGVESQEEKSRNGAAGTDNAVTNANNAKQAAVTSLSSLPFKVHAFNPDLSKKIKANRERNVSMVKNAPKEVVGNAFEVGLEWNVNAPFKRTDFLFNSIDSVNKPVSLLIPGIWVTKSFGQKHSLTLTMQARQPYFGNNKRLAQVTDTIPGVDSAHWYRNTDLIKTIGFNAALQYHYQVVKGLSVGAGIGYSRTSGALMRVQMYNRHDMPLEGEYVSLKGAKELNTLLNTDIFYFRAGLAYKIGRFQTGINILAPLSNISGSPQYSIREMNGQFFLRFRVW
ncbi:hypothetical protein MUK70_21570 [Dyadobacter chenwenxiniae]|uniref:Uncharacterized protein n=1 Tax=Dyadobacter chenwenxiniae TaxID=2906456 RepID=A0A9X1PLP9_9BACT|nr:hypothetical protein [Dyadobacter chenwenxiniae]MCF0061833.1 hypothetical protein [Dyadobacter chenwenxiniae]UON81648.1 hypothetical protein MUK70_21570 [Dyadobacter chenwenxiniae]